MKKKIIITIIIVFSIIAIACNKNANTRAEDINNTQSNTTDGDSSGETNSNGEISVWATYWDTQNVLEEINKLGQNIENICYFAAYFNENEKPFLPEETTDTYDAVKNIDPNHQYQYYLTFVNDLDNGDGTSSLKDTTLLYHLLSTKEQRSTHINEILTMTIEGGYDGIEIDYEAIKKDQELWKLFIKFIKELNAEASKRNISVRVLLEPNAPIKKYTFPSGPEYIMMCYNLYGYGTKSGPKANPSFIKKLIKNMGYINNKKSKISFAFATGGFDFGDDGSVTQLTEAQAVELLNEYNGVTTRDNKSQCLVYQYVSNNISHEVWFADYTTIQSWIQVVKNAGDYGISIWRLGGNLTLAP